MTAAIGRIYDIAEAAEALNVRFTWLQDRVTERRVPFSWIGTHARFTEAHLAQILADGYSPVRPERGRRRKAS